MSRPTLKEEEKRVVQVNIRLTAEESRKACEYASAAGLTPANWIRQKVFTGKYPSIKISPLEAKIYQELNRIGVNLNQAIKQVHEGKVPKEYFSVLTELLTMKRQIIKLLIYDSKPGER